MLMDHKICSRCIMDTTDPDIRFNEQGVCNHCTSYEILANKNLLVGEQAEEKLNEIVDKIKKSGLNKDYDSIIGLSGGVDSSYLAYQAKKLGLRPLAVHFDNGWDSELSVRNIENIVKHLGFDLYTYVIDWEEFKDLQVSFFKASVIDIELLTDNAIISSMYKIARKKKIKFSLEGSNIVTEGVMPKSWNHWKADLKNIKAIQKRFGTRKIESFPTIGPWKRLFYQYSKMLTSVPLLNFLPYNKEEAVATLEREFGWKNYGGKHYESIFTKFYQAYVLPVKFNVDKRKAHLSSLICSGQLTRSKAMDIIKEELYRSHELKKDKEYVVKKLGLTEKEFDGFMKLSVKSHLEYPSNFPLFKSSIKFARMMKAVNVQDHRGRLVDRY